MITTVSREELARIGAGYRAAYLVQQAGYTLGVAAAEEEAIEAIVEDPQLVEDVTAARAQVESATKDRDLMAAESKALTGGQRAKLHEAKVWRRQVAKRASRVRRQGQVSVPVSLATIGAFGGVPEALTNVNTTIGLMEANLALLGGESARALMETGRRLYTELGSADASQEQARLAGLPVKVQDFYAAKGLLYLGIKVLNDAGQELHAGSAEHAAKYNMKILYRSGARPKKPVVGDGPLG